MSGDERDPLQQASSAVMGEFIQVVAERRGLDITGAIEELREVVKRNPDCDQRQAFAEILDRQERSNHDQS